jgi:hypothetical protein
VVFPSEVVWKIQILKFKYSFAWQGDFQTKTLSTTKFNNFSRPTTFMFVVFPFEVVFKIQILNF